jgi:hypothetical protein
MRVDTARCSGGCGAIVQLPSLKARSYSAKCEACVRRAQPASALKAHTREPVPAKPNPELMRTGRDQRPFAEAYPDLAAWMPGSTPQSQASDARFLGVDRSKLTPMTAPLESADAFRRALQDEMDGAERTLLAECNRWWYGPIKPPNGRLSSLPNDAITKSARDEFRVKADEQHRRGREKNARIDACTHDFASTDGRCLRCAASPEVIATRMEHAAKSPLDYARLNVFRLESQYRVAPPQERKGIGDCLREAQAECARLVLQ